MNLLANKSYFVWRSCFCVTAFYYYPHDPNWNHSVSGWIVGFHPRERRSCGYWKGCTWGTGHSYPGPWQVQTAAFICLRFPVMTGIKTNEINISERCYRAVSVKVLYNILFFFLYTIQSHSSNTRKLSFTCHILWSIWRCTFTNISEGTQTYKKSIKRDEWWVHVSLEIERSS